MGETNGGHELYDDGSRDWSIDRRRFIAIGGAALVTAAGCVDSGGEPEAEDEASDRPPMTVRDATTNETAVFTDETLEVTATIENEGDRAGTFHAELRMNDVIVQTEAVEVGAGDTESVTFTGTFSEPGEYDVYVNDTAAGTVRVELPPPEFELREASLVDRTVAVGEELEVRATIANVGGREGAISADLQANGRTVETREVTIDAGVEESVTIAHAFDEPGRYAIDLNGTAVGTATVERPATFEVVETSLPEATARVGEPVEVTARVANVGERAGTTSVDLERGGEAITTREVTIEAGETATVRFSVPFENRGVAALSVNGVDVGRVYVTECETVVSETITVGSGSTETYAFDLTEYVDVTVAVRTRNGVEPTLAVVGPSETLVENESGDPIEVALTTGEPGRHEIRLENDALLPWREGTWAVEIELCRWAV